MPLWNPSVLDNLQYWVRGDSLSYLTNGTDVNFWADESGNGFHVQKATTATQNAPDVLLQGQNGLPVVDFDSSRTECLFGGGIVTQFGTSGFFITSVFKTATTGGTAETVFGDNQDNSLFEFRYTASSNRPIKYFGTGGDADSALVNVGNDMTMASYDRQSTGSSDSFWRVNGKLESTETEAGDYDDNDATTGLLCIGCSGTQASPQKPLNGQICEIVMYADALTDAERILLEGYLANKWDSTTLIESDGGSDHTYKTKKPLDGITLLGEDLANETLSRSLVGDLSADLNMVDAEHGKGFM
tara:strand:+ start:2834 stop:3736 length:903 start_codon:yes stop_codon:yes gene_type:complete